MLLCKLTLHICCAWSFNFKFFYWSNHEYIKYRQDRWVNRFVDCRPGGDWSCDSVRTTIATCLRFGFGYYTPSEFQVRLIVSAIALTTFASALVAIPEVGSYLAAIVGNIAKTAQGAALLIILHNLSKRLTPVTQS